MKINISYFNIYHLFFYLMILFLSMSNNLLAQSETKKIINHWEVNLSFGALYDNNILKYSDKYIERFLNSEDEGRFHINRYDDLVLPYSAGISYSAELIGNQITELSAEYNSNSYSFNSIKNWSSYSAQWLQYLAKNTSILVSYTHIPSFYIRHFRDDDWVERIGYTPETYKPYEFSKDDISAWIQQYLFEKKTRVRLLFSYMQYFHNEHYTEYDSEDYLYGFRIYQSLSKSLRVEAGYQYISSEAKGIDVVNDTNEDDIATRGDATNNEHIYTIGAYFKLPKVFGLNNDISIAGQYQRCIYETGHYYELDPLHAGRFDKTIRVYSRYNLDIFNYLSLTAFLNWIYRETDTSAELNKEYISDEKDYSQYQLGVKINYKIQF